MSDRESSRHAPAAQAQAQALGADDPAPGIGELAGLEGGRVGGVLAEEDAGVGEHEFIERAGDGVTRDVNRELTDPEVADVDLTGGEIVGAGVGHEPAAAGSEHEVAGGRGGAGGGVIADLIGAQDGVAVDQLGVAGEHRLLCDVVVDRPVRGNPQLGRLGRCKSWKETQRAEQNDEVADPKHADWSGGRQGAGQ